MKDLYTEYIKDLKIDSKPFYYYVDSIKRCERLLYIL